MKEKRMDQNFRKRLQHRLYYGETANLDVPSFPLTELAVESFQEIAPEKLGQVDLFLASDVIRDNHVSPCSVVLSMIYAKRLRQQKHRCKDLLQTMSSADVFLISMMMASKYLYDEGVEEEVFNDEWADNTDQDVDDVNKLEMNFLQAMDWKLFVGLHEFEETLTAVERRLALQEGLKRGWLTYTEMDVLMTVDLARTVWTNVGAECSKLLTALSAAYLTSLLSMMGSAALAAQFSGHLSSVAMALVTLQSSHAVSSGVLTPALSLNSNSLPRVQMYGDNLERNGSADSVLDGKSLAWNVNDHWQARHDNDKPVSMVTNTENLSAQTGDTAVTLKPLWTFCFLDTFVSRLWSALYIRSKLTEKSSQNSYTKDTDHNGFAKLQEHREHVRKGVPDPSTRRLNSGSVIDNISKRQKTRTPDTFVDSYYVCSDHELVTPDNSPCYSTQVSAVSCNRNPCSHFNKQPACLLSISHDCGMADKPVADKCRIQLVTMKASSKADSHSHILPQLETNFRRSPVGFVTSVYQMPMLNVR